jgi:antitoxin component YwqK of YwqJK toxin-antitoxin module
MKIERKYYDSGQIRMVVYSNNEGFPQREDGPAVQYWYKNGQENFRKYYINGYNHREDGPAVIEWFEDGQIKYKNYYRYGNIHRDDGPAFQLWFKNGQGESIKYYINGKKLSKEDFEQYEFEQILKRGL